MWTWLRQCYDPDLDEECSKEVRTGLAGWRIDICNHRIDGDMTEPVIVAPCTYGWVDSRC